MSATKRKILIVDDSPEDIHFVIENLKDDYAVLAATSGAKALEMASNDPHPDVILMDVMMPEMNGYETCRQLKNNSSTKDIDVIFVSAHDSTDEKLAGYEAGGSDYLIKPVNPKELLRKVKLAIDNHQVRSDIESEKNMAVSTAMTAMSSAGELGVVLEFLRRSFMVDDVEELGRFTVEAVSQYALECTVQIMLNSMPMYFGSREHISPLEQELLMRLKESGRIREHGKRLIVNFDRMVLLIKNMPDDAEMCGRIRDNIAILVEGADSRIKALEMIEENNTRKNQIEKLVVEANKSLQEIENTQAGLQQQSMAIVDKIMMDVESSFLHLGLTEEQEANLLNIVRSGVEKAQENLDEGHKADVQLKKITQDLQRISKE